MRSETGRGPAHPAERGVEGDRQGRARGAPREDRGGRRAEGRADRSARRCSPPRDGTVRELALQVPNPADASVPDGGEDDGVVLRDDRRHAPRRPSLDHAAFGEAMGWVESEQAVPHERLPLRLPHARGGAARARAGAVGHHASWSPRASRRSCRRCWCARRRWSRPASSPPTARRSTRSTTTSCSSSAPARCRSRRSTAARSSPPTSSRGATSASRRASVARPAPTARTRAASSASTSSTRSRCSRTRIPRRRGTSTRRCSRSRSRSSAGSGCRTAS